MDNKMNTIQETSLKLIQELLDGRDDKTFLAEYKSVENNIGPTINEYLGIPDSIDDDTVLDEGGD